MSVLHCDGCDALIDTDSDVEAYFENLDQWFCPACRGYTEGNEDMKHKPDNEQIWLDFYVRQAHRAAMDLRWLNRRLSWDSLEKLREAKRWIDGALGQAEEHERKAENG